MNAKKSLSLAIAILVVLPIVFSGCKVGKEDPFISFRSRKARVCGTWTVNNLTSEILRKENNVNTRTITTIDGESWKQEITILDIDSVKTYTGKITKEPNQEEGSYYFFFDENGKATMTYKYEFDEDLSGEDDDISTIHRTKVTKQMTGSWDFLSGIDEYKNQERLAFVIEDLKTSEYVYEIISSEDDENGISLPHLISNTSLNDKYSNGQTSTVYILVELRNKEMKLRQNIDRFHVKDNGEAYQEVGFEELVLQPRK